MDAFTQGRGNDVEFKKPAPKPANRRIRQSSDLPQETKKPNQQKASMPHKSDRNRGRG